MVDPSFSRCFHTQVGDNWCWAACIQMVLEYQGMHVSQSSIVKRAYGDTYDITANKKDIVRALNGWYKDGHIIYARYETFKSVDILVNDLVHRYPIIVGLNERGGSVGHSYVLSHIYFTKDYYGNLQPFKVVVVNPAKSYSQEETLDWNDFFQRINTIVHVYRN